jgi:hypothetical protein
MQKYYTSESHIYKYKINAFPLLGIQIRLVKFFKVIRKSRNEHVVEIKI